MNGTPTRMAPRPLSATLIRLRKRLRVRMDASESDAAVGLSWAIAALPLCSELTHQVPYPAEERDDQEGDSQSEHEQIANHAPHGECDAQAEDHRPVRRLRHLLGSRPAPTGPQRLTGLAADMVVQGRLASIMPGV